ncbi:hypothetical protein BT69DRAFT_1245424 [Atractiella rhizophila]|nr:hypothetical protein BT69DRAFT_1245424 [Atractiella rhizophila]
MPTIKEILQSLVDDGLVFSEKIGTSNYFWSYPSAAAISVKNALEASRKEVVDVGKSREAVRKELSEMLKVKEEGEERTMLLEAWKSKNLEERRLKLELDKFTETTPEDYGSREKLLSEVKGAAERWTEYTDCIFSWLGSLGIATNEVRQNFQIAEDFEDIAWDKVFKAK